MKNPRQREQIPSCARSSLQLLIQDVENIWIIVKTTVSLLSTMPPQVLHLLCVLPTHQRQGLGTLLINEGLAVADEHNARTYIEASPKGLALYLKLGWKPVDEIVIDMKQYGGSMVVKETCLMRQPGGK